MITIQQVTSNVQSAPRQSNCVLEDCVQYSKPSVINNSNYVITVSYLNCLKCFCLFFVLNNQVHRDFLIILYKADYVASLKD
jgi:hypothetical protein